MTQQAGEEPLVSSLWTRSLLVWSNTSQMNHSWTSSLIISQWDRSVWRCSRPNRRLLPLPPRHHQNPPPKSTRHNRTPSPTTISPPDSTRHLRRPSLRPLRLSPFRRILLHRLRRRQTHFSPAHHRHRIPHPCLPHTLSRLLAR